MQKILSLINSKESNYITLIVNFIMFIICVKQIFIAGKESTLIDLNTIMMLPFVYCYSIFITMFLPMVTSKDVTIKIIGVLIISGILLTQFPIIDKGGLSLLTIPVIMSLVEIFRNADSAFNQLVMLVVTMMLMFIALFIVDIFKIEQKHTIMYASLYFLFLCYRDFRTIRKLKNLGAI